MMFSQEQYKVVFPHFFIKFFTLFFFNAFNQYKSIRISYYACNTHYCKNKYQDMI